MDRPVRARAVRIRVPATSANLGPGLDAIAIALALHNDVTVRRVDAGSEVSIEGEGSERFATGEGNLVVRAARAALEELGAPRSGLELHCLNRIPSARGLGSSAAAIVAGVVAGAALAGAALAGSARAADDPADATVPLDYDWMLDLCARLEGHPDNVAGCLLGGVTIAWYDATGQARAVRADPASDLVAVALVPSERLSTAEARRLLPATVPLHDATHSAGRAALLSLALTGRTDLLLPATEDRLHQSYRAPAMPESLALMDRLRERGLAATISGAGPTVLVLGTDADALIMSIIEAGTSAYEIYPLRVESLGGGGAISWP